MPTGGDAPSARGGHQSRVRFVGPLAGPDVRRCPGGAGNGRRGEPGSARADGRSPELAGRPGFDAAPSCIDLPASPRGAWVFLKSRTSRSELLRVSLSAWKMVSSGAARANATHAQQTPKPNLHQRRATYKICRRSNNLFVFMSLRAFNGLCLAAPARNSSTLRRPRAVRHWPRSVVRGGRQKDLSPCQ